MAIFCPQVSSLRMLYTLYIVHLYRYSLNTKKENDHLQFSWLLLRLQKMLKERQPAAKAASQAGVPASPNARKGKCLNNLNENFQILLDLSMRVFFFACLISLSVHYYNAM